MESKRLQARGNWYLAAWLFCALSLSLMSAAFAQTDPGPVNMQDRESARQWFNTWWPKSYGAPMGFTGDVEKGIPGDVSQAYKDQTLLRINIFRRMAGEQPVTENPAYSAKSQAAAVLCAVNDELSHFPPATWKFYNATAAEGCGGSDLVGEPGPTGIAFLMLDGGANNMGTGHRNHLLTPALETVGVGNSPAMQSASQLVEGVEAIWVNDPSFVSNNLKFEQPFVTWPARGYIPHYLVPGRWSIYVADAHTSQEQDFSSADVAVQRSGLRLGVAVIRAQAGLGLVFTLDGTSEGSGGFVGETVNGEELSAPSHVSTDILYHVVVSGIKVRSTGALWSGRGVYEYDVAVYNPQLARVTDATSDLVNISTRSFAGEGSNTQIAGFILNGKSAKRVLVRAGGPYLAQFGIEGYLRDPVLELFEGSKLIATNDNWDTDYEAISRAIESAGVVPFQRGSPDAAIVMTLQPGVQYTAHVLGRSNGLGSAIVEVYDLDPGTDSRLINISTRSYVGTGADIQIGGFILKGEGPRRVLVRAGGPYLSQFGVTDFLKDPVLRVFKGSDKIAENDDWEENAVDVDAASKAAAVFPFTKGSKDSGLILTLDPGGPYTVQVSGKVGATGNAIVEVYSLP